MDYLLLRILLPHAFIFYFSRNISIIAQEQTASRYEHVARMQSPPLKSVAAIQSPHQKSQVSLPLSSSFHDMIWGK